jgi:hypothetical protein
MIPPFIGNAGMLLPSVYDVLTAEQDVLPDERILS